MKNCISVVSRCTIILEVVCFTTDWIISIRSMQTQKCFDWTAYVSRPTHISSHHRLFGLITQVWGTWMFRPSYEESLTKFWNASYQGGNKKRKFENRMSLSCWQEQQPKHTLRMVIRYLHNHVYGYQVSAWLFRAVSRDNHRITAMAVIELPK